MNRDQILNITSRTGVPPVPNPNDNDSRDGCPTRSRLPQNIWRRHLPHYQLSAGYYFITFATYNRRLLNPSHRDCVFNAVRFLDGKKYELFAAVVLNDHVHMVIRPIDPLSEIMHSIKSYTAHELNKMSNRTGKVWQEESHDRVIRSDEEFEKKIKYIANNPIRAKMAKGYEEYKWLFIKGWLSDEL